LDHRVYCIDLHLCLSGGVRPGMIIGLLEIVSLRRR